jgi:homogentisate 1,2-dioxygenase
MHPRTERIPYYHRNLDFDEVSFIHGGSMGALPLPAGLIAHTPQGINHGPSEEARELQRSTYKAGDESTLHLVMVECREPFTNDIKRPPHARG